MALPAQLDAAAACLRAQAAGLASVLEPAVRGAGTNVWQGPAQEQLWERLLLWRSRLAGAATELEAYARAFELQASRIRAAVVAAAVDAERRTARVS